MLAWLVLAWLVASSTFPVTERVASGVSYGEMFTELLKKPMFWVFWACMFLTATSELAPGQWVNDARFNDPAAALGAPFPGGLAEPDEVALVSLGGFGGSIILAFDHTVVDDPHPPGVLLEDEQPVGITEGRGQEDRPPEFGGDPLGLQRGLRQGARSSEQEDGCDGERAELHVRFPAMSLARPGVNADGEGQSRHDLGLQGPQASEARLGRFGAEEAARVVDKERVVSRLGGDEGLVEARELRVCRLAQNLRP